MTHFSFRRQVEFVLALLCGFAGLVLSVWAWVTVCPGRDLEVTWVAFPTAILVGYSVWIVARGRGGRSHQVLAVLITYLATSFTSFRAHYRLAARVDEVLFNGLYHPVPQMNGVDGVDFDFLKRLYVYILLGGPFLHGISGCFEIAVFLGALFLAWRINAAAPAGVVPPPRSAAGLHSK